MDLDTENVEILEKIKQELKSDSVKKKEGKIAKFIEAKASKIPNDVFLWTSLGTAIGSLTLKFFNKNKTSLLVGQFIAPILLMGVYNKLVKLHGSEKGE